MFVVIAVHYMQWLLATVRKKIIVWATLHWIGLLAVNSGIP